jgi:hypothetical protein
VRVHLPQPGNEGEIFGRGQLVIDHRFIGQPRGHRLGAKRVAADIVAKDRHAPAIGIEQPGDNAQRGGLARAIGPEQRIELPRRDRQRQVADHRLVIGFAQPLDAQRRHFVHAPPPCRFGLVIIGKDR